MPELGDRTQLPVSSVWEFWECNLSLCITVVLKAILWNPALLTCSFTCRSFFFCLLWGISAFSRCVTVGQWIIVYSCGIGIFNEVARIFTLVPIHEFNGTGQTQKKTKKHLVALLADPLVNWCCFLIRSVDDIPLLLLPGAKNYPAWSQETHHCLLSREALWGASGQASSLVSDQGEDWHAATPCNVA